jgi:hypothetical protein
VPLLWGYSSRGASEEETSAIWRTIIFPVFNFVFSWWLNTCDTELGAEEIGP